MSMTAKPSANPSHNFVHSQPLNEWIAQHLAPNATVQMRLRGNILHVLSETPTPLHQAGAMTRLVDALLAEPSDHNVVSRTYPQVYQLYIYSRRQGETKPDWTAPIYLNRLDKHQAQLHHQADQALKIADAHTHESPGDDRATDAPDVIASDDSTTAIVLSHLSLAKQGDPDAIAWYLSEVLSTLDVGVWVSVRAASRRVAVSREAVSAEEGRGLAPFTDEDEIQRLWVWCEATYSPDPLLIAEPVTERLRQLSLTQFKDAVIVIQVHGEDTPDWSLRIDLTPAEEMLREWGRWGDEGAIARLINLAIADLGVEVTVERKDESLHGIVQTLSAAAELPAQDSVIDAVAPLLETLAPQGLHRVMLYGQADEATVPAWVRCIDLPALEHSDLLVTPTELAQQGDLPALAYLLTRLLNPEIDDQLATGGIRIQVLQRDSLLHVMADAPICPTRRQVVPQVLDFLDTLDLPEITGIRLYGRRAGQQRPAWSYGKDFQTRPALVPKAEPVFAVSDSYVGDLLPHPDPETLQAEPTPEQVAGAVQRWWQRRLEQLRHGFMRTQLVVGQGELENAAIAPSESHQDVLKIGLVWGAVGVLLALQVDWIFGQIIRPGNRPTAVDAAAAAETTTPATVAPPPAENPIDNDSLEWDADDWQTDSEVLGGDGFTQDAEDESATNSIFAQDDLVASPDQTPIQTSDFLAFSPYPSFRSQQMDEKLALYHQRLAESGPPDVLVIGSSRALRGVDPAALQRELAALGYGTLSIFNFGVNGATAQVVDLTIRRALAPHELPRIIVWADGARAFNSGRVDVTFNAIEASEGYRELGRRNPDADPTDGAAADAETLNDSDDAAVPIGVALRDSYQALDQTLSEQLGQRSAIYENRDELKALVRDQLLTPLVAPIALSVEDSEAAQNTSDMPIPEGSQIDFDGFLALDARFNPATYYQLYARVAGAYDSDYENFGLEGKQTRAFNRLLDYTQQQNIPVIFVNTPLTDEYLDKYRSDAEEEFQRLMLQYSAMEDDFIFRDLGQVWTNRYDYFSDPSHLNRYGAYQVSLRIAQDPMIPWPTALDVSAADPEMLP